MSLPDLVSRAVPICLRTLGTSFKRFPWSLDGVFLQDETYLTDTLPRHYYLTNPNLVSTTFDPLRQASRPSSTSLPGGFRA